MPLLVGRDGKVVQGESLAQRLSQLPEDGQALFASDAYVGRVPQFSRDIAEGQQRASPAAMPYRQMEVEGFLGEGGRPGVISQLARRQAEEQEGLGGFDVIAERAGQGERLLAQLGRPPVLAKRLGDQRLALEDFNQAVSASEATISLQTLL